MAHHFQPAVEEFDLDAISALPEFDPAEYLQSKEAIAAYLNEFLEDDDPAMLAHALGVAARARGMTEVAKDAGIAREALYKALRPGSSPRMETIMRVMDAFGVRLVAVPKNAAAELIDSSMPPIVEAAPPINGITHFNPLSVAHAAFTVMTDNVVVSPKPGVAAGWIVSYEVKRSELVGVDKQNSARGDTRVGNDYAPHNVLPLASKSCM
jgi:probable addiction module antidote protein